MQIARRTTSWPTRRAGGRVNRAGVGGLAPGPLGAVQLSGATGRRGRGREVEFLTVRRIELTCPVSAAPRLAALLIGAPWHHYPYDPGRE